MGGTADGTASEHRVNDSGLQRHTIKTVCLCVCVSELEAKGFVRPQSSGLVSKTCLNLHHK